MLLILADTRIEVYSDSLFVKSQKLRAFKQESSRFENITRRYSSYPRKRKKQSVANNRRGKLNFQEIRHKKWIVKHCECGETGENMKGKVAIRNLWLD
jgi:hypothetical protein